MKKIFLVFIVMFLLGCSNDNSNTSNYSFIGKWTGEKEIDYDSNNVIKNQYDLSTEECYHMTTYEFKSNNQFIKDSYDYDGNNCVRNTLKTYKYTYSNNTIIINNAESAEVVESTNTVLKLKTIHTDNSYTIVEYSKIN